MAGFSLPRWLTGLIVSIIALSLLPLLVLAQNPTPAPQGFKETDESFQYAGSFSDIALAIDAFWAEVFSGANRAYTTPGIVALDRMLETSCGFRGPAAAAFYCPADLTIFLSPAFLAEQHTKHGDYAPIVVLAHEWGHHVQTLLQAPAPGTAPFELQADCLAGAFTQEAERQGLLEQGDLAEAILMSESAGDPIGFPQDSPGAHGTDKDRIKALVGGYLDGLTRCDQPFAQLSDGSSAPTRAPIPIPTLTRTPIPLPTPTQTVFENPSFLPEFPDILPLDHAACFRIESDGPITFDQLLDRLGGTAAAHQRLTEWNWRASANRTYACDDPPPGDAGWIDVSLHLFSSAAAAQQAVDYFAAVRADGTQLSNGTRPQIGDHAVSLAGLAANGNEFTIYASEGPLMVRVTGVAPSGIPFSNVLAVARSILATPRENASIAPTRVPSVSASAHLPTTPAVTHAECFRVLDRGSYSYSEVRDALATTGMTASQLVGLGWVDGAYVVFTCATPPTGRANQIDVVIHQFRDPSAAREALPFFSMTYLPGDHENRACDAAGTLVVCVTGRAPSGSPLSDVAFVLQQVLSRAP